MRTLVILCLLCLHTLSIYANGEGSEPRLLFVFGDSYADTGNTPPNTTASWKVPYGMFWPGSPSGRWSDGFVSTDILASTLGIPSPTQYARLALNVTISGGVNFAVGGSGVTYAFGTPPFQTQAGWFANLVAAGLFTQEDLSRALFYVSVVGNDYSAYNGSLDGYFPLSHKVPLLIDQTLRTLYSLGARNFIVSSLTPLDCVPSRTAPSGFTECEKNTTTDAVILGHNHFLGNRLENITRKLENSSVLYLQQTKAMRYVLNHLSEFNLTEGLKPCCVGQCGAVNVTTGIPLYTVCENPEDHFFWDGVHPTGAGWKAVVGLYNRPRFTWFARTLSAWIGNLRL
ncbi:hypothetical protein R1flu_000888 [Riccia fluitans]|uniref:GDSL esterase/lipase n=1 Tax=Riccia fluitans TaxID=41844 RepID=A0ABD1Y1P2_9MARC